MYFGISFMGPIVYVVSETQTKRIEIEGQTTKLTREQSFEG